ncbi:hypothetical protein PIROE2DRAFT_10170 [Piromyces sp. E2]|nr:hypothetical protein PIROE2DRAFT_10170 [Piromyces sp. E2]|eukprot:OUM63328.1 hypothetical protein PIROE2DRAFT_10170 [Piromyces sp. E2]
MSEEIIKRLFIGGIAEDCTEKDLNGRFERFGQNLLAVLLRDEWDGIYAEQDKNKSKLSKKKQKRQQYISEAEDLTPVTDITGKDRKGWVIGRYGRAMTVLKIKNPKTKQIFKYDPSKYKNSLKKFNTPYVDIPINKLILNYDDVTSKTVNKKEIKSELQKESNIAVKEELTINNVKLNDNNTIKSELTNEEKSKSHIKFDDDGDEDTNDNDNGDDNEEYVSSGNNLKLFDSDDDEEGEEENLDDLFKVKKVFEGKAGEERFKLQKSFNGDSRFKLGDEFIDDDEEDEEDEEDDNYNLEGDIPVTTENGDIDQEMEEDHKRTFDVLNMIFGDELPNAANEIKSTTKSTTEDTNTAEASNNKGTVITTKSRLMWNDTLRYDPDAEDAEEYLVKDEKNSKVDEEEEEEEVPENKVETSLQAPEVSKEKHFEVSKDLTSILLGETKNESTGFSLFGNRDDNNDNNESKSSFLFGFGNKNNDNNNDNNTSSFNFSFNTQQEDKENNDNTNTSDFMKNLSTSKLFFFHFNDKDLRHRTLYSDTNRVFMRTDSIADINAAFEEKKQELTQEFKRKHKSATRKKIKMKKLNNNKKQKV